MSNENFDCEIVRDVDTGKMRAEIYELPGRELVGIGPWRIDGAKARQAALKRLGEILLAAINATIK